MELARQVEFLYVDACGASAGGADASGRPTGIAEFLAALWDDVSETPEPPREAPSLPARSYVLWSLARIFGGRVGDIRSFLDDYLDPSRWRGLSRACL